MTATANLYTVPMRSLLLALLFTIAAAAPAPRCQTIAPTTITFTGAPTLPEPDLLALSGLHPGQSLTQPDIEAAMNRMADTGLFSDIRFKTEGPTVLHFELVPQEKSHMRRIAFTNLPWYTGPELLAALHTQLPLFTGMVPVEGDLSRRVATALEAILKQRQSLTATVKSIGSPGGTLNYSIANPPVMVGKLLIQDARFESAPSLIDVESRFADVPYTTGTSEDALRSNLADAYLNLGYLDQQVDPITHAVPRLAPTRILVDLTGAAHPGERYKITQLELPKPLGAVTQAELDKSVALKVGEPTSAILVKSAEVRLDFVFENHGYLDAATVVESAKDSAAHTIAYKFVTTPGTVYKMRSLVFAAAMSSQQQSILTQAWKLPRGTTYDGNIAASSYHQPATLLVCGGPLVLATLVPDKATHEVDVNLSCSANLHP